MKKYSIIQIEKGFNVWNKDYLDKIERGEDDSTDIKRDSGHTQAKNLVDYIEISIKEDEKN